MLLTVGQTGENITESLATDPYIYGCLIYDKKVTGEFWARTLSSNKCVLTWSCGPEVTCLDVHSSTVHNRHQVSTIQMSISRMDEALVYSDNRILHSNEKK